MPDVNSQLSFEKSNKTETAETKSDKNQPINLSDDKLPVETQTNSTKFYPYKLNKCKRILYLFGSILTLGILPVVGHWYPKVWIICNATKSSEMSATHILAEVSLTFDSFMLDNWYNRFTPKKLWLHSKKTQVRHTVQCSSDLKSNCPRPIWPLIRWFKIKLTSKRKGFKSNWSLSVKIYSENLVSKVSKFSFEVANLNIFDIF